MVTAINNDNILSSNDSRTAASGKREAEQATTGGANVQTEGGAPKTGPRPQSPVDIARASQLYSQANLSLSAGSATTTPEQAAGLAAEISRQFGEHAEQAIRSHGELTSTTLTALLETPPS